MTKEQQMNDAIQFGIGPILAKVNEAKRAAWNIVYKDHPEEDWLNMTTTEWERKRFHLRPGGEWILIWDNVTEDLLYAIDVSADSVLTALAELMDLLSRKF